MSENQPPAWVEVLLGIAMAFTIYLAFTISPYDMVRPIDAGKYNINLQGHYIDEPGVLEDTAQCLVP